MRAGFQKFGWIVLLGAALRLGAQTEAVAAFDSGYVETGNPFVLHLLVPQQYGTPESVDFSPWDTLAAAPNVLGQSSWQTKGSQMAQEVTLMAFDSAQLHLPPLAVVFSGGDTLYTNPLELTVLPTPSPDDLADMYDIKDIYREPTGWRDYLWPVLPIAIGVLLFAFVVWLLLLRRKKTGLRAVRTLAQPPHELALRQLAELERKQLWQTGQLKKFYSELTHIVREYLEQRYNIPALESASDEILRLLLNTSIPAPLLTPLSELLRWADLAKFAKGAPPEQFHARALREVRYLVEQTKPGPAAASGGNGTPVTDHPTKHPTT